MNRFTALLITVVAFPVLASADPGDDSNIGRYQISSAVGAIYFLDTATGAMWVNHGGSHWQSVDSPIVGKTNVPKTPKARARPVSLKLPTSGEVMPMIQREKRAIPCSSGSIWVHLGDVTGGQVFVEVVDINGEILLKRTSLKNEEYAKFSVNGEDVYLQITDLINNLLTEDICKVNLTSKKPKTKKQPDNQAKDKKTLRSRQAF